MKKSNKRNGGVGKKESSGKIVLGFDMDGVLIDHADSKMRVAGKFGIDLKPEQTPSDVMHKLIPYEINQQIQNLLYDDRRYALRPLAMRGARTALKEITEKGTQIFLISRRKNPKVAIELLEKHGFWPDFFHEKNSYFVDEPEDKNRRAIELGITHYLDDEIRVLEKLADVPNRYLFDKYQIYPDNDLYRRVFSWQEFLSHLD